MSQINEELQKQQSADFGAAVRKVLGDHVPVIPPGNPDAIERRMIDLNRQIGDELSKAK